MRTTRMTKLSFTTNPIRIKTNTASRSYTFMDISSPLKLVRKQMNCHTSRFK